MLNQLFNRASCFGAVCGLTISLVMATPLTAAAETADLNVTITGIKSGDGQLLVCLFSKPDGFPRCSGDGDAARSFGTKARKGSLSFVLKKLPVGNYAISAAHDQNNDGKIERHFLFGYPTEGAGTSNYSKPPRSKPEFSKAQFQLNSGHGSVQIMMHYP